MNRRNFAFAVLTALIARPLKLSENASSNKGKSEKYYLVTITTSFPEELTISEYTNLFLGLNDRTKSDAVMESMKNKNQILDHSFEFFPTHTVNTLKFRDFASWKEYRMAFDQLNGDVKIKRQALGFKTVIDKKRVS